ncbi:MAG TPA: hypothetical protein VNC61_07025 [Acidimicrobiales bacterium]|nr:hypothetical protein [Acidimicrobiales bacterium]
MNTRPDRRRRLGILALVVGCAGIVSTSSWLTKEVLPGHESARTTHVPTGAGSRNVTS